MRLFLSVVLLSFNVGAHSWKKLEAGKSYRLKHDLQLPQAERSHALFDLLPEKTVKLLQIISTSDSISSLYVFDYQDCPGPQMKGSREMIPVQGIAPMVEVGVQLAEHCKLHVQVKNPHLETESFFH